MCRWVLATLKTQLATAPALGLPNLPKRFQLNAHERKGIRLGVLTQTLGGHLQPLACLSVNLDHTVQGRPAYLRSVAATCELLQEAEKFSSGQPITIFAPHQVLSLLEQRERRWLTAGWVARYQAVLLANPKSPSELQVLSSPLHCSRNQQYPLSHDCVETIDEAYSSRAGLQDYPPGRPDWTIAVDGSSSTEHG